MRDTLSGVWQHRTAPRTARLRVVVQRQQKKFRPLKPPRRYVSLLPPLPASTAIKRYLFNPSPLIVLNLRAYPGDHTALGKHHTPDHRSNFTLLRPSAKVRGSSRS
jgi:hypothetical protein